MQDDDDDVDGDGGGKLGKNILMLRNLGKSATYTCVAASDLGNIAYDVDVIVKGIFTLQRHNDVRVTRDVVMTTASSTLSLVFFFLLLLLFISPQKVLLAPSGPLRGESALSLVFTVVLVTDVLLQLDHVSGTTYLPVCETRKSAAQNSENN